MSEQLNRNEVPLPKLCVGGSARLQCCWNIGVLFRPPPLRRPLFVDLPLPYKIPQGENPLAKVGTDWGKLTYEGKPRYTSSVMCLAEARKLWCKMGGWLGAMTSIAKRAGLRMVGW